MKSELGHVITHAVWVIALGLILFLPDAAYLKFAKFMLAIPAALAICVKIFMACIASALLLCMYPFMLAANPREGHEFWVRMWREFW